jgi:type IV pilus assembly protein PilX
MNTRTPTNLRKQSGAALVIGLMILLVLTVLGISSMGSSTTALKITQNTQNKNRAFQFAESVINVTVDAVDYSNIQSEQRFNDRNHPQYPGSTATVNFTNRTSATGCPGTSFKFSCVHFEIAANGVHQDSGAQSRQVQGVYRVAPTP